MNDLVLVRRNDLRATLNDREVPDARARLIAAVNGDGTHCAQCEALGRDDAPTEIQATEER